MARRVVECLLAVILAVPLAAQVRESIEVRVLEIEATVLDRSGRPVEGLKREDFRVRVGNREVPVTNFFAVRNGVIITDDERPALAAQKTLSAETSIPTSLVIFIDDVHLSQSSRKRAIDALKSYVSANIGANTTATLIRYNKHFDVRLRPTEKPGWVLRELDKLERESGGAYDAERDRERMIELIDAVLAGDMTNSRGAADVAGESPDTIFYRLEDYAEKRAGDVDRTVAALEDAIELASGFTGRKVLLYVSDGLPQTPALELFEYWERASKNTAAHVWRQETVRTDIARAMRFDRSQAFQRVAETAQRSDVAVYSFDAGGLRGYEGRGVESFGTRERINTTSMQSNLRAGLEHVAEETGGMYIKNDNDIGRVLTRMSEQFTSYYSIGVAPARGEIRISVKNHPELRVIASKRRPPRTKDDELQQNVRTRLYTRAVENPLNAKLGFGTAARVDGHCVVALRLEIPEQKLPPELTPSVVDVRMVMLNEQNDESELRRISVPFASGRTAHSMMLRIRPERHVFSLSLSNPLSGEVSYLQGEMDGTTCR